MKSDKNGPPSGYVVHLGKNLYLSRSMRAVRHCDRQRSTRGVERAWVHKAEDLLKKDEWSNLAVSVIPAYYDRAADITRTKGDPIPFQEFISTMT